MALLYAFVLAGFVESLAGPIAAAQSQSPYQELCLVGDAGNGAPGEHRHSVDCCLYGCRIGAVGSPAAAPPRLVDWDTRAAASHRAGWFMGRDHPPARLAAAGPFGARGPPSA